jgi:bacillolysin
MKHVFTVSFVVLSVVVLSIPLQAQHGFDVKKRKPVMTTGTVPPATSISGRNAAAGRSSSAAVASRMLNMKKQDTPGSHRVLGRQHNALPSFIETSRDRAASRLLVRQDIRAGYTAYLQELSNVLQLDQSEAAFDLPRLHTDAVGKTHVRLNQVYKHVPVYGAEVIVHLNEFGEGESFNGRYTRLARELDVVPSLTPQAAAERAMAHAGGGAARARSLTDMERKFIQFEEPQVTLYVYEQQGMTNAHVLAYHVVYCPSVHRRLEYFVDAHSGAVLHHYNSTCFADGARTASATDLNGTSRTVNTYQKGSGYYLVDISRTMYKAAGSVLPDAPLGGIMTVDMNNTTGNNATVTHVTSTNNTWGVPKTISAHFNGGTAYEYFRTKHGRNSIDGSGGTIISIVNVPDENGAALDNAFWNGKAMFYGNGNVGFKPLAGSIDVAGHEMTHGVVQNTANLEYQGESGAINESMADIFGSMMDPGDWLIGEDVVKTSMFASGALRSLSDPHNGGSSLNDNGYQPRHMNERYTGAEDNGGVHINSGIPNFAFFKLAQATTRDKAAQIFYKALDDYLTKSSQFIDLRLAVVKAAGDLYGASSNEVTQAGLAFDGVGIGSGQGGDYTQTLPGNPGAEYMLIYNTDTSDPNTLFRVPASNPNNFAALSKTGFTSRPSVTDDGSAAVFVAADHTIHVITTDPNDDVNEVVLQNEPIWSNAVVSKGGTKLAAVTTDQENKIYVYDFNSEQWASFELYNPTYSEGVTSGGPVYADALEWDYSGEYLVYDCFNRIVNTNGSDIEYWDVNFIRVWDQAAQDFGDGTIEKLFTSLPPGLSIGNPSFAKTVANVVAFDYIDANTGEYMVVGCNIETSEVKLIAENTTLGWPSYNKNDTRVAFTTGDGTEIDYATLNSDKISSSSASVDQYTGAKWPVYYALGDRKIGDEVVTAVEPEGKGLTLSCYPNPFEDELRVKFRQDALHRGQIEIRNLLGQEVALAGLGQNVAEEGVVYNVSALAPGQYIVRVRNAKTAGACKLVKVR